MVVDGFSVSGGSVNGCSVSTGSVSGGNGSEVYKEADIDCGKADNRRRCRRRCRHSNGMQFIVSPTVHHDKFTIHHHRRVRAQGPFYSRYQPYKRPLTVVRRYEFRLIDLPQRSK